MTHEILMFQNQILSMHYCKATIQDYKSEFIYLIFFPDFWDFVISIKMGRFFEQNSNFSLFYQNLTKTIFFKNLKTNWLKKVWTNRKWLKTLLTFDHLLVVSQILFKNSPWKLSEKQQLGFVLLSINQILWFPIKKYDIFKISKR
jgi:hypothetical protein